MTIIQWLSLLGNNNEEEENRLCFTSCTQAS
jgi:hypothetical protein